MLRLLFKEPDRFRDVLLYYNTRKHPYLSINLDIDLWTIADENEKKALRALFARNGIETDEKITRYLVENPEKGDTNNLQLLPEGGFRVAVPGSKIRYEFPKLSSNAPRAPRYSYQWQMIQPDSADGKQRDSAVVAGAPGKSRSSSSKTRAYTESSAA
ncbi:MAG: hypothetical protein F9K24_20295 [Leptonema illini]|uniref:Uncharacterized protein n=1 Tax=Leptonema illini TaxID=183 RepID=A0A833GXW2_9LEPT|nr:MAG: hypothetical protein F9K24_20295 [Leptonema illini]